MEWYYGSGIDELVVPKDGELPDRLPSPDSWFKWGTSDMAHNELNFNGKRSSSHDVEMRASIHGKDRYSESRVDGAFSNSLQQDYQLDNFLGVDQMDNDFMSSLLDDNLPLNHTFQKSGSGSPGSPNPAESFSTRMVDSQNNWTDINSTESSKYVRTDDIYESLGSEQYGHHQVHERQVEHFSVEENTGSGCAVEETETSIEEFVLQDLEIVMTQLTEKTRICFRDALYRLANNSRQHTVAENDTADVYMEESALDDTTRSMKSERNTIDRAVANLMYSEMACNVGNGILGDMEQQG